MESLFIYIAKASGLIGMFYIAYYLLLRKETFFTANRWFLLVGLMTSVILPWIVFTTVVWVEPTPPMDWSKIPMKPVQEENFTINWYLVSAFAYIIGTALFLVQFVLDFYKLNRVLKGKTSHQQADHKFIDLKENIAPFSYFNTIVYNSSLYNESEMESILEHEKVHSEQYHTVDVLITRIFCILFWLNPFMWLYKKAILQNLEFIADNEASKNISDKKAYQLTLLKITTHENCVVLTNHFYQSLIKKRIVMLNKNQSKKWNSWKYALVLPVLVAFVFLFQIEVIAKEKNQNPKAIEQSTSQDVEVYKIDKNTTDNELKEKRETIRDNFGLAIQFSKIKRNGNNELTAISVEIKGKDVVENRTIKSTDPIKPFGIAISKDANGKLSVDFEEYKSKDIIALRETIISTNPSISVGTEIFIDEKKSDKAEMDKLDPEEIASVDVVKNSDKNEIRIVTKKDSNLGSENEFFINGQKSDKDAPVPPVPPTPPVLRTSVTPPAMPKPPTAPKGDPVNGDKKAWKEFEKQMEEYASKMKNLEPQMESFDKQMVEFDKQMEPFEKEMKVFEEKMKVYEKEMEKYLLDKKKNRS
jgi:hypothetical protein